MPLNPASVASFPLWPITKEGKCGCGTEGCDRVGKHPAMSWGSLGPAEKWGAIPGGGLGLATGSRSGVFVVDLDGEEAMQWWADRCDGDPWATYSVNTSRGVHLYFQMPDHPVRNSQPNANPIHVGVDIRGDGGYVVMAGSPHKSGHVYEVADEKDPVLPAPDWLLTWPGLKGGSYSSAEPGVNAPTPIDLATAEGERRIKMAREYLAQVAPAIEGQGGSGHIWVVAIHLIRRLELPESCAFDLIKELYNPRCEPEWSDNEIHRKLEQARDKSDILPGIFTEATLEKWSEIAQSRISCIERQEPKKGHEYTFVPGIDIAATDIVKTTTLELTALLAGKSAWEGVLQYNECSQRIYAVNPPLKMDAEKGGGLSDDDISGIRMYFQSIGLTASKDDIVDAIRHAAKRLSFHPVKDYLAKCEREPGILDKAATRIFGSKSKHADLLFRKFMIAAVRRIFQPGCQVDTVLVLQGKQGERKSTCIKVLFGEEFTRSQMPDLANKDASAALAGKWGIELAELDRVLRAETSTVKEFLTRTADDYRPPYGRMEVHAPRQCVFIGTCNMDSFLRDSTGNRRFWPIPVETVDLEYVSTNRDSMWGEAVYLSQQGEQHWLTKEEELDVESTREQFVMQDPWHESIQDFIRGKSKVKLNDVFETCIARGVSDRTKYGHAEQLRVADTLRRLGCTRVKIDGCMVWKIPEHLENQNIVPTEKVGTFSGLRAN